MEQSGLVIPTVSVSRSFLVLELSFGNSAILIIIKANTKKIENTVPKSEIFFNVSPPHTLILVAGVWSTSRRLF